MCTTSQILTIVGLLLEFLSVFIPVWHVVFLSKKERYYRKLVKDGRTTSTILDEYKKDVIVFLILLGFGILLQGIAVFI